jgi:hypothetical protein
MATMPKRHQGDVRNDASATMMPAPPQRQWQWHHGNVCNDTSIMMATMPKRHWQRHQRDDDNDVSAATAMMSMAPKQRLQ